MKIAQWSCLVLALGPVVCALPAVAQPAPDGKAAGAASADPVPEPAPPPTAAPPATPAAAVPATPDAAPAGRRPTPASWKIETPSSSLKFGVLLQPQYEMAGSPSASGVSHNLYVRRTRFLVGATLFKNVELFMDTDYPDLFKSNAEGVKATPGLNIQDAYGTVKVLDDQLKVDMGYMLPPSTHNAVQGAGTLFSWDYFSNSFRNSNSFNSSGAPVGRDAGVQLRGLVLDNHLEYRAGLFQGRRYAASPAMMPTDVQARNMFRFAARLQFNVFDPETGFFYAGTYLGKKKVLSFGGAIDVQGGYIHWGLDGFLDMPLGPGVVTAQVNLAHYNGKSFIVAGGATTGPLAKQTDIMAEAGYLLDELDLSPILRFERQALSATSTHETRVGGGVAYWPYGHAFNLKAFFLRVTPPAAAGQHGFNQINLQTQVYVF